MPLCTNPFRKHEVSDFPGVYVPLSQAIRHPSVVAKQNEKIGPVSEGCKLDGEAVMTSDDVFPVQTMESLRAEIDMGTLMETHDILCCARN